MNLQTIEMDDKSFGKTSTLSLQNLPKLGRIVMGGKFNFWKLETLHLENVGDKNGGVEVICNEGRRRAGLRWNIGDSVSANTINSFKRWLREEEEEEEEENIPADHCYGRRIIHFINHLFVCLVFTSIFALIHRYSYIHFYWIFFYILISLLSFNLHAYEILAHISIIWKFLYKTLFSKS